MPGPGFAPGVQMMGAPHMAVVSMCAVSSAQQCQPVDQRVRTANTEIKRSKHTIADLIPLLPQG
eukprot:6214814-Amphidinium_carterae.1